MNTALETQIRSSPVRVPGDDRETQLQHGAMPRVLNATTVPSAPVRSRTTLPRKGLDAGQPSFAHGEEVPRAGARLAAACSRTRMPNGRVLVWPGTQRLTGRGKDSSFLDWDRLAADHGQVSL
jgi:hypothetical protein